MAARGVAMEHLQQKHLDGHDRIEEAVAPLRIADRITSCLDDIGLELGGPVGCETLGLASAPPRGAERCRVCYYPTYIISVVTSRIESDPSCPQEA